MNLLGTELHTHGHAAILEVGTILLLRHHLPRLLVLKQLLMLSHGGHGARVVVNCRGTVLVSKGRSSDGFGAIGRGQGQDRAERTVILELLLLQQLLLLSGIELLQHMSMRVRTRRHPAHQGRVYLSSRSRYAAHGACGKLMRHPGTGRALLARVMGDTGAHRMASDAGMAHCGWVPCREVWAHTCSHHR